jgi:di/tripeptidase
MSLRNKPTIIDLAHLSMAQVIEIAQYMATHGGKDGGCKPATLPAPTLKPIYCRPKSNWKGRYNYE